MLNEGTDEESVEVAGFEEERVFSRGDLIGDVRTGEDGSLFIWCSSAALFEGVGRSDDCESNCGV